MIYLLHRLSVWNYHQRRNGSLTIGEIVLTLALGVGAVMLIRPFVGLLVWIAT